MAVNLHLGIAVQGFVVEAYLAHKLSDVATCHSELTWFVVETADIIVYNTNGCHIYFIEATVADDGSTSISSLPVSSQPSRQLFDLQGRKVTRPAKGIYLKDGRKIVIK